MTNKFRRPKKEEVLNLLSRVASRFRSKAGESLATVKQHAAPFADATTPSLEAWKLYSAAVKMSTSENVAGVVPLLQRAIQIDPRFAMAYAFLGRVYGDTQDPVLAAQNVRKAYELRDRSSDPERFFITWSYALQVTGNLEEAQRIGETWAQTYPRAAEALTALGLTYQFLGKHGKSVLVLKRAVALDPYFAPSPVNLAWSYLFMERYGNAESTVRQASQRNLGVPDFLILPYVLAFDRGDQAAMDRTAALGRDNPETADWMTNTEAVVEAYSGHLEHARSLTRRAMDLARQAHQQERTAMFAAGSAVREAFFGNGHEARKEAKAALELSKSRDVEYGAAFALMVSGDAADAQIIATDLEQRFPEDTCVQFTYLPVHRALLALNQHDHSGAIEQLQLAAPYDLGVPCSWFGYFGNPLCAVRTWGGLSRWAPVHRSCRRVPEDPRPSWYCFRRPGASRGTIAIGSRVGICRRPDKGKRSLPGFAYSLEGRRPGYPDP